MGEITSGLWINTLTKFDKAFLEKWNNVLTVYAGDTHGRAATVPARMRGIDEEMGEIEYPLWIITPMDFTIDMRRFNQQEDVGEVQSQSGYSFREISQPVQPYLGIYMVNGYSQDHRVYREMQEFAARTFPVHGYLTVDGENSYVETVATASDIDDDEKHFVLQLSYNAWMNLSIESTREVKTVFNNIKIGFTQARGRFDLDDSEEELTIEPS